MSWPQWSRFVCEKCGRSTLAWLHSDCRVWIDSTEQGSPVPLILCPEHKAEYIRWISDFIGKSDLEIPYEPEKVFNR